MSCDCSIKLVLIKSDPEFVYEVCKNTPARLQIVRWARMELAVEP